MYVPGDTSANRASNVGRYREWYFALEESGAVAEAFGDFPEWSEEMFIYPKLPGSRRALGRYLIPDSTPLLDLDDAKNLWERGLRPTQVVTRNRSVTQEWSLRIFEERNTAGQRRWSGVRWWSVHRPQWRTVAYWGHQKDGSWEAWTPEFLKVEELSLDHPAVVDAARELNKPILRTTLVDSSSRKSRARRSTRQSTSSTEERDGY